MQVTVRIVNTGAGRQARTTIVQGCMDGWVRRRRAKKRGHISPILLNTKQRWWGITRTNGDLVTEAKSFSNARKAKKGIERRADFPSGRHIFRSIGADIRRWADGKKLNIQISNTVYYTSRDKRRGRNYMFKFFISQIWAYFQYIQIGLLGTGLCQDFLDRMKMNLQIFWFLFTIGRNRNIS